MKICFITDAWLPIWGGGQEHVKQLTKVLEEKYDCQVDIIAPTLVNPKFEFQNFFHRVWFAFWVLKFLLTSDYDIYHSHNFSTAAFLPLVKLRGRKTAITVHGAGKNLVGGGVLNALRIPKFLMWLVLRVWPFDYRFSASKISGYITVGNGVNVDEFDAVKAKKDPGKFRIFWIGRKYDPIKGVSLLEEAVRKISDPKIVLDIADGVYGQQKIERFKRANLFVLPSLSEGLPLVLLEAMAAKLPVVATKVGDVAAIVKGGINGYLVDPGNTSALESAIRMARENKRLSEMGENGYKMVKRNYSWDKVAEIVFKTYK